MATTPAPLQGTATPAGWPSTWAAALQALELDAAEVEAMIIRLHAEADWVPPVRSWVAPPSPDLLGPLPPALAERARALLARHARAAQLLAGAMTANRRQARASGRLAAAGVAPQEHRPVYVDAAV